MASDHRDQTAIVGIGSTPFYRRGQSLPQTTAEIACKAIIAALDDSGLSAKDIDGFAYYTGGADTALLAQSLGIPEIKFSATLTGGGSGCPGSVGLASAAIIIGQANVVVSLQQVEYARLGSAPGNGCMWAGQHSRPILREIEYYAARIDALIKARVVGVA